jgi:hypothetical protein
MTQDTFATQLGFTSEDLAANQSGSLTESQRERLRRLQRLEFISGVILGPIFILLPIAIVVAAIYLILRYFQVDLSWLWLILLVGVIVNIARFVPNGLKRWRAVEADLAGPVATAAGRASVKTSKVRRATAYRLTVGGAEFDVPESIANAFKSGAPYRIYYTPEATILLSAERL